MAKSRMSAVATRTSIITNTKLAIATAFLGAASLAAAAVGSGSTTNPCGNEPLSKTIKNGINYFCLNQTLKLPLYDADSSLAVFDVGPYNDSAFTIYTNGNPFKLSLAKAKDEKVDYATKGIVYVTYLGKDADGRGMAFFAATTTPVSVPTTTITTPTPTSTISTPTTTPITTSTNPKTISITCVDPDSSYKPNLNALLAAGSAWNKYNTLNTSSLKTKSTIVTTKQNGFGRVILTDVCSSDGKQVNEAICIDTNQAGQYLFDCPNGTMCAAGACITKSLLPQVLIIGVKPTEGTSQTMAINPGSTIGQFKITNKGNVPVYLNNVFKVADNGFTSSSSVKYDLFKSDPNNVNAVYPAISTSKKVNGILTFDTSKVIVGPGQFIVLTIKVSEENNPYLLASGNIFQLSIPDSSLTFSITEKDLGVDLNKNGNTNDTISGVPVVGQPYLGTLVKT